MTSNQPKIRIGVLYGGRSGEHEVSLRSARSVMESLDPTRYEVVPIGITKEGLVPGKYGPPGYVSDMPAFGSILNDADIAATLSYIQSRWPPEVRRAREEMLKNRRG